MQDQLTQNQNKVQSFEKFFNICNPLGQAYVLKPGKSIINLPVNFQAVEVFLKEERSTKIRGKAISREMPEFFQKEYDQLELFNYSPIPFSDLYKRQFLAMTKI